MARAATTADAFNAVAEPRRRQILDALAGGECPVNDLVRRLDFAQPQASKHLRVLREVGAVEIASWAAAPLPAERHGAEADPRLGEGLRGLVGKTLRAAGRRARGDSRTRRQGMTVTSSGTAKVTLPTDDQILITREFDAPKELVFKAWTTPELVKRWRHANRGEVTHAEVDLRVGGTWRYVRVTPDGFEVGFHGEYREIVPNERIVSTEVYEGVPGKDGTLNTLTLTEAGGRTTMTVPRAGAEQGGSRRDHRLRDGGGHAGRPGSPGAARDPARRGVAARAGGTPARAGFRRARGAGRAAAARARDPARRRATPRSGSCGR